MRKHFSASISLSGTGRASVLCHPTHSRLALRAEPNFVKQRDFNQLFGFKSYAVAVEQNGPFVYWHAPDGVGITTREGILVSSRGIAFDLMASETDGPLRAIVVPVNTSATRTQRYLDGEGQIVPLALDSRQHQDLRFIAQALQQNS